MRDAFVAIIEAGGSVLINGVIVTRVADLPSEDALVEAAAGRGRQANREAASESVIVWQGAWSGTASYETNDVVSSGGEAYLCVAPHTNHVPPNATYWSVLASAGAQGATGAQGAAGAQGGAGAQGEPGAQGPQGTAA
jgi:hypothetical protein